MNVSRMNLPRPTSPVLFEYECLSYEEISGLIGMPVGSIGPTRQRYLQRLRAALGPYLEGRAS